MSLSCHGPHASDYPKITLKEKASLCLTCHEEKIDIKVSNLHEPLEKEGCIVCHDPHASENRLYLKYPEEKICLNCHEEEAGELVKEYTHEPFAAAKCTECHDSRGTGNHKMGYGHRMGTGSP